MPLVTVGAPTDLIGDDLVAGPVGVAGPPAARGDGRALKAAEIAGYERNHLAVGMRFNCDEMLPGGYGDRILCAVFAFEDAAALLESRKMVVPPVVVREAVPALLLSKKVVEAPLLAGVRPRRARGR